jgi:hypothetical protein
MKNTEYLKTLSATLKRLKFTVSKLTIHVKIEYYSLNLISLNYSLVKNAHLNKQFSTV